MPPCDRHFYIMGAATSNEVPLTATQPVAKFPLFRLPPELRNRIYEYAVYNHAAEGYNSETNSFHFSATTSVAEPALLLTCKAVRSEALGIFKEVFYDIFLELLVGLSSVTVEINSFHPAALVLWGRTKALALQKHNLDLYDLPITCLHAGPLNYDNLVLWLRYYHEGTLDMEYEKGEYHMIYAMFVIAGVRKYEEWHYVTKFLQWTGTSLRELYHWP